MGWVKAGEAYDACGALSYFFHRTDFHCHWMENTSYGGDRHQFALMPMDFLQPLNPGLGTESMNEFSREINALIVYILSGVLLASMFIEFYHNQKPCPLCLLQRLGMIGVASGELLNIRFGIRMHHYALSYLSVAVGIFVSIWHILLHICPGASKAAVTVFGHSLYFWAFNVFTSAFLGITFLLFFYRPQKKLEIPKKIGLFPIGAFVLITLITLANFVMLTYRTLIG